VGQGEAKLKHSLSNFLTVIENINFIQWLGLQKEVSTHVYSLL
jgi:hypothetical protein